MIVNPNAPKPVAVSLPFSFDAFGNVAVTTSQEKIWGDRVRVAVGTALGERVFRPDYGTTIPQALFDSPDAVKEVIEQDISSVFAQFLPALSFSEVIVDYDSMQNIIAVEVLYSLPGEDELENVTIGVATLSGNNPITEDIA
jgi:phage baseplate assembly protein W